MFNGIKREKTKNLTVVILLGHGHGPQEVWRAPDRLPLVLDEHLVHAHLLSPEGSVTAVRLQIEVHVNGSGGSDDLCRDGVHVHLLVENVDLELALK